MLSKTNKKKQKPRKHRKRCSIDDFQMYSHLNAISDEIHGTAKTITYGRPIVRG